MGTWIQIADEEDSPPCSNPPEKSNSSSTKTWRGNRSEVGVKRYGSGAGRRPRWRGIGERRRILWGGDGLTQMTGNS